MPRFHAPSSATATDWPHVNIRSLFRRLTHLVCVGLGGLGIGGFSGAMAWAADGPQAALESFTGEWEGELRVFALDGFLLKTFPAHRYYNWNGAAQVVVTQFFDGASDYETQATHIADADRLTATVARPGQAPEEYTGALEAGAVVWTNASNNKRDYSERLVTTNGVVRLETTSSEIMRVKGVSGVVRVTGSFHRNGTAAAAGAAPAPAAAPASSERITALERELAAARQAAATATRSSAATQSDLTRESADLRVRVAELETERAGLATRAAGASSAIARFVELEQSAAAARRATELAQNAAITAAGQTAALRDRVATLETQLRETEAALATVRAAAAAAAGQKLLLAQRDTELADARVRLERSTAALASNQQQLEQTRTDQSAAATNAAAVEAELKRTQADALNRRASDGSAETTVRIEQLERDLATRGKELEAAAAAAAAAVT